MYRKQTDDHYSLNKEQFNIIMAVRDKCEYFINVMV
jgi:hypothetical protein